MLEKDVYMGEANMPRTLLKSHARRFTSLSKVEQALSNIQELYAEKPKIIKVENTKEEDILFRVREICNDEESHYIEFGR